MYEARLAFAAINWPQGGSATMNRWQKFASAAILSWAVSVGGLASAAAQTKPEGEMRFALYVTVTPALLDPGEAVLGNLTPFWMLYALHDALDRESTRLNSS